MGKNSDSFAREQRQGKIMDSLGRPQHRHGSYLSLPTFTPDKVVSCTQVWSTLAKCDGLKTLGFFGSDRPPRKGSLQGPCLWLALEMLPCVAIHSPRLRVQPFGISDDPGIEPA